MSARTALADTTRLLRSGGTNDRPRPTAANARPVATAPRVPRPRSQPHPPAATGRDVPPDGPAAATRPATAGAAGRVLPQGPASTARAPRTVTARLLHDGPVEVSPAAHAPTPARPGTPPPGADGTAAPAARRGLGRVLRTHLGTVAGIAILGVLLWRLGTGVFLDGLRRIDAPTLAAAVGIGLVTTVFSAWRWQLVARGLGIRLPFGSALADYYRALFLNAALPGGVVGDVHRAVHHGRSAGDLGRGVRSVVLERTAGQGVLAVLGVAVLLTVPSPVMAGTRHAVVLSVFAALGALAIVLALRMNRGPGGGKGRAFLAEAREALLSRRNGPGVLGASVVVLAGYVATFLLAARVTGTSASVTVLLPLAVLALLAMSVPLNVGGWGPREGVTAWAFGAAGLGAGNGLAVAVVYGVLSFAASAPGALVLVARWCAALRARAASAAPDAAPGHAPDGDYSGSLPAARRTPSAGTDAEVSNSKYAPKESVRAASSSFPFSAAPSEGRPMTPESV
ncbi:UPF0104 family protein [Streptomyces cadmiisoli]|uniref:UPF0104 family protein n=1 Tax=Streptomyces cadmiisoli TaxID=2184053 RepID=A0A2Z4IVF2_9ACTN|nr:lysylphosphatidylglycerol synthase transmembrane domain-containing protein [Streptomyces cadmiisoli]AWW36757.1 UPF0104 family protein [Streptomyces cadmiisoli]